MMASRRSMGTFAKSALVLCACISGIIVGFSDTDITQSLGRFTRALGTTASISLPPLPVEGLFAPHSDRNSTRRTADSCSQGEVFIPQCGICALSEPDPTIESLQFIRMPSSAAGSFTVALRAFFGCNPPNTGCWGGGDRVEEIGFDCNGKLRGCFGVNPYSQPMSVTMLREPASRIRSAYYRGNIPRASQEQQALLSKVKTIRDYVSIPGVSNMQTKLMIGSPVSDQIVITPEQTAIAIENLKSLAFFGLREYFSSSVCMFFLQYGGARTVEENPDLFAFRGRRQYNASLPIDQLDLGAIYYYEDSDLRLYEAAVSLFKERARQLKFDLVEEYPIEGYPPIQF